MVVKTICFGGAQTACCFDFTTIEQDRKKTPFKLGDVTHNDVLGFDSRMLFLSADIIAPILTKFYNVSVETETVIPDWKLSKVTPIYKGKGSKDEAGNYRPISLISHIMKIFEKEIKLQVMGYLEVNNLITSDQSAYRNQHNTQTALHRVVDDWLDNVSDGHLTGVCSFDITKCFDTINHAILLKKMYFYGFNDHTSKWFQSYLNKREQIVSCRNQLSGKCQLQIGVPQGSVLGPLLFLIYVNDINRHVHLGSCSIYADDTLIYCTGNNITELKYNIQKCVTVVHEWYESNKLVINTSKSNVMLLTTRQMLSNMRDTALNVFIGNHKLVTHKLPQCNSIKYLGVDIDNVLSWNLQTDSISKKLVFIISRLSRLKPVLPSQMLMYIYTSIIQPKIDYAISIWGYTTAHNINKVQRLQNRAARILTGNFDYVNTRGIDLVKNLGLMNVTQRRDYFMIIMMFKSIHGLVPDYICDEITMQRDITVRTTRSTVNNNVHVPHIILECCKNAFTGVDLGGIPLSREPQISRRNTRFAGAVIRPGYQFLPRFGDLILGLAPLY